MKGGGSQQLGFEYKLRDFEQRLNLLLATQTKLRWELAKLKEENQKLKSDSAKITEEYKELKKKHKQLQLDFNKSRYFAKIVTNKLTPTGGISELVELIDGYIQDIDTCILKLKETL